MDTYTEFIDIIKNILEIMIYLGTLFKKTSAVHYLVNMVHHSFKT
jgi:hypothetical protein